MQRFYDNIKKMFTGKDKKNNLLIMCSAALFILMVIGATFAFFASDVSDGASSNVKVITRTTDSLMFEAGEDILIDVNSDSLGEGKGNIAMDTFARATLKSGSDTTIRDKYNVYLQIDTNSLEYTTSDGLPELILQITDPTGAAYGDDDISNLTYVTAGVGDNQVQGFDITTTSGLVKIAENYIIEAAGGDTKVDNWIIKIIFINLDTDQIDNTGKMLDARMLIQKEEYSNPDLYIATTYDGSPIVPSTFGATAEVDCFGNETSYNYRYNRLSIKSINAESAACNLKYTTPTSRTYLNNKVISLVGNGEVYQEDGYRYEGTYLNNYVWFNNELWRIIGVFGSENHGKNANLVKIIRARSLGGLAWDKDSGNNWPESSLYALFNGPYYNQEDGNESGNCYMNGDNVEGNCDYSSIGIDDMYRDMIENVTWYLGEMSSYVVLGDDTSGEYKTTVTQYYLKERASGVATTTGHIGLMYVSDYLYSAAASTCDRTMLASSYQKPACAGSSWIYGPGLEWTIMSDSYNENYAYRIHDMGYISPNDTNMGREVRPTLYLKSSVFIIEGTGTMTDPFVIGM